jgi:hypothetical protein
MKSRSIELLSLILAITIMCGVSTAHGQNISLDHPVKCGVLQCFPSADHEHQYYYLPANPHVALNESGKHEFSFTRYVKSDTQSNGDGGILKADGGGIVHFLVDYTVSDKQLDKALKVLKDIDQDASIRGPIIFEAGSFALVSSFAADEEKPNELTKQVVGVGRAPLIEGLKAAVSIHLTKMGAQILWQSFQMDTPDVSLLFEMTFSGLNDPADATITADWKKLQQQADVTLGAKVSYMGIGGGFDYSSFWQQANDTGAINIEYKGDPDKLQSIIDRTYAKLHHIMFEPIRVEQPTSDDDDDLLTTMLAAATAARAAGGSNYSAPWEVNITGGYRRRKLTQTGNYTFNFRQRSKSSLTTAMAGNIGSLYRLYGDDPSVFRTINLTDEEFRIREISVALDARDEKEFSKYINHVTLTVQKEHGSGKQSTSEVVIKRSNFALGKPQRVNYSWDGELSIDSWMQYRYKADWSFVGGANHSSGWLDYDSAAISLTPPYQYREVEFTADPEILKDENVRLVSVRVKHDFFGRQVSETINLVPGRDELNATRIFAVPPGNDKLEYTITWTLKDRRRINSGRLVSDQTIIFCDEVPAAG